MNLKKLFNAKYLFQNMKKSAQVLAIFVGLIPVLNTIILLLSITSSENGYMASLEGISAFTMVGMFILPFILALCFYDFMFKKKSVDFIGSMPISKKSIFVTNTLGGWMIIAAMLLITAVLMWFTSIFFVNVYIPIPMLFDYFILSFVGYLFVYSAVTLAFSISGNMITGLAVTLLLLFFLPFLRSYTYEKIDVSQGNAYIACSSESCQPKAYECYSDMTFCLNHTLKDEYQFYLYESDDTHTYTLPYSMIGSMFGFVDSDDLIVFDSKQLAMTFLLTIVYTIVGFFIFRKRKLEISETSFGNFYFHLFVKFLTMVPICIFTYEVIQGGSIYVLIFVFILLLVYYFVFDLITRKKIEKIQKQLGYFLLSIIAVFIYCFGIDHVNRETVDVILPQEKIEKIEYYENSYASILGLGQYDITDRDTIAYVLSLLTTNVMENDSYYSAEITIHAGGKEYKTNIQLTKEEAILLKEKARNQETVKEAYSFDHVYALKVNGKYLEKSLRKDLITEVKSALDSMTVGDIIPTRCSVDTYVYFYEYKNHDVQETVVSSCISKTLQQKIAEYTNQKLLIDFISDADFLPYVSYKDDEITSWLLNYYEYEVSNFIKQHIEDSVDVEKEVLTLHLGYYSYASNVCFYTNAVEEFYTLVSSLKEKAEETEEYQDFISSLNGDNNG